MQTRHGLRDQIILVGCKLSGNLYLSSKHLDKHGHIFSTFKARVKAFAEFRIFMTIGLHSDMRGRRKHALTFANTPSPNTMPALDLLRINVSKSFILYSGILLRSLPTVRDGTLLRRSPLCFI